MTIRGRELHEGCVELHAAACEERGHVGEEHGDEVGAAGGDGLAHAGAVEERDGADASRELRRRPGGSALEMEMVERDVLEIRARRKRVEQRERCGGGTVHEDGHAVCDAGNDVCGGDGE